MNIISQREKEFREFHEKNPHVYDRLVVMTNAWMANHRRASIKMFFEVIRYEHGVTTTTQDHSWKLNNNLHSRYARKIMAENPHLKGAFETRELKSG